jgi:hypothetical protein
MARPLTPVVIATFSNALDESPVTVSELQTSRGDVWEHSVIYTENGVEYTEEYGNDYSDGYGDALYRAQELAGEIEDPEPTNPMSPLEEAESGAGLEKIRDWQYHERHPNE